MARLALTALSIFPLLSSAVQNIAVNGANFITNSTGNRFSIIGVDYQPGGSSGFSATADPLSDATVCLRDAILMQELGINTIRVYNLDGNLDHNECASIFNAAGIYMILDVNSGLSGQSLDRSDPASTYTLSYLQHIFSVVEAFSAFPNTLGFFAGNEIINQDSSYDAPSYIRAVVRDLKDYISTNIARSIPVGYSAADVSTMLSDTWNYLGCELANSTDSKIDFFGLNDYEWCGDSSFTQSGYNQLVTLFEDTTIPVFFSEYGCNLVEPRTFTNVPVLYGEEMTVLSGGLVYEYSQETDNYGLVAINSSTEVTLLSDYTYLYEEYRVINTTLLTASNTTAENLSATSCAASLITESAFLNSWDIPTRPSGGDALVSSGITSANKGSLVSVSATTMPATVYNYTGATVTGMKLNILGSDDSNQPGGSTDFNSSSSSTTSASSSKATAKSVAAHSAAASKAGALMLGAFVVAVVLL